MALNFSHRPLFSTHLSEDNMVSPMRIGNVEDRFDYGRERSDRCVPQDSVHKDILDVLPSDPFGMDISTTFTAITGWLEDLEVDYGGYGSEQVATKDGNYSLFAGLNFIWSNAIRFQALPGNVGFDHKFDVVGGLGNGFSEEKEVRCASGHSAPSPDCDVEGILSIGDEFESSEDLTIMEEMSVHCQEGGGVCYEEDGGAPHEAFSLALSYLGVRDLLAVEMVCRSLRTTVQSDTILWKSIHIDQPLNEKITDDVLLQLTHRAQGHLLCLSLVDCPKITDDGLKHVLENNPRLAKLSVPGCTRLSIDGIVTSLKTFKTTGTQGVKHLRIGGLYGITPKHFEELKVLLGADSLLLQNTRKPHFYHRGNFYLSCEDDRAIDIEMCPRCQNLRLVYDCPVDGCQGKEHPTQVCRACTLCIARCVQCGRCINDSEYEETFCLELLCSDCLKQLFKCQEKQVMKIAPLRLPAFQESSCGSQLHG